MKVNHYIEEKILEVKLTEEIDHHSSEKIRTRIDYEIRKVYAKKSDNRFEPSEIYG